MICSEELPPALLFTVGGVVSSAEEIWQLAVDRILIKIVDSEIAVCSGVMKISILCSRALQRLDDAMSALSGSLQVHEEVLRLLLAACSKIDLLPLANYLHHTLSNSRYELGYYDVVTLRP